MGGWWEKDSTINRLADWSYSLHKAHPHQRILALGQSAAWIVQGVGMIRKLRRKDANIGFIPFTGAFLDRDTDSDSPHMEFQERDLERPPSDRLIPYFNLLSSIRAQPKDLTATAQKVVIAEMIKSGNGLASFLDTLSRPDLQGFVPIRPDDIEIYVYDTNPPSNRNTLRVPGHEDAFHIHRKLLTYQDADLMENITPHNRANDTSSRLVPMYRLAATAGEKGLEIIPNQDVRKLIRAALHKEIQHREQNACVLAVHP